MITIKTPEQIKLMHEAGVILAEIIEKMVAEVKPGITPKELDKLASELVLFYKVKPAFLGYEKFPATACISVNESIVHGVPTEIVLKQGDLLSIDMGVIHKGFYSDSAMTMPVLGDQSYRDWKESKPESAKLVSITNESLSIGIKQARVGNTVGDIGNAVQRHVESNGLNVVRSLVGHGVGRDLHEEPHVPNFGKKGEGHKLTAGMVIAIEPMVTIGNHELELESDGFTYRTKDGSLSAHFEHTVAITEDGPIVLTDRSD